MEKEEFFINNNGMRMRRCCASCEHKGYTMNENYRKCKIHDIDVIPSDVCDSYSVNPKCMDEGGNFGTVRKKHFIDYLTEKQLEPEVVGVRKPTPFLIEKEYRQKFGNPNVF